MERLDKLLAHEGFGTRKDVKKIIHTGAVTVNGVICKSSNVHINEESDIVCVNDTELQFHAEMYIMLNKPDGYISATYDKFDPIVLDLIDSSYLVFEPFPVGRLDIDTEGLLLITNDGELAHQLLSPKKHVDKTYYATIDGLISSSDIVAFREGLDIGEEALTLPAILEIVDTYISDSNPVTSYTNITVTIHEGKFHQVKRMFNAIGRNVLYLKRLSMGNIVLDDTLKLGEYRPLTDEEIANLKTH